MIPYIHVPDLHLGPLTLHPFGLLVATGVIIGTALATKRARRLGLDLDRLNSFITWMLAGGFIGGHMLDEIFYHPSEIVHRWYSLFMLWEGLSSFGGFTGGLIGVAPVEVLRGHAELEHPASARTRSRSSRSAT